MNAHRLLPHGSTGINIDIGADGSHLGDAAELERLGYDALWIAGGQLDSLDRVTELVRATTSIRIATGIVPLGVYETPAIVRLPPNSLRAIRAGSSSASAGRSRRARSALYVATCRSWTPPEFRRTSGCSPLWARARSRWPGSSLRALSRC